MIPILYPGNRLAPPAVVTPQGAAAGFPVSRLFDGDIGLPWTDSAAGTRTLLIDQGATPQPVDTWLLAAGHNLTGTTVAVASGPTSGSLTLRASGPIAAATLQRLTWGAQTDRWWSVTLTSPSVAPSASEMVLALALPLPAAPVLRGQERGQRSTVIDLESYGGHEWNLVRGPVRWTATYPLLAMTAAQRDALLAAHAALDGGARHCYLTDGEGVTRWVNWADRHLRFTAALPDRYDVTLAFREVLGAP